MVEEKLSQKFRLKNIDETKNYFIKERDQNVLMSKKHKKICTTLNYSEHFLILASAVTGYISISAFASFLGIPIRMTSSTIRLKICAVTARIKKYISIFRKKKKEHDKIVLLRKTNLNGIEVFVSKGLIDSNISQDEFVLINNALKEYDDMKVKIKNLNALTVRWSL